MADRRLGGIIVVAFAALAAAAPSPARAEPNLTVGATIGGGVRDLRTSTRGLFHLGLRSELMLFRERDRDMGLGPYLDVATASFDTLELGGGASWLVPVTEHIPVVVSAGAFARRAPGLPWEPGLASTLFAGSRSHNFHSLYGLAAGLFVQGRWGLGDGKQADVIFGAQIDTALLALPFLLAYGALRR